MRTLVAGFLTFGLACAAAAYAQTTESRAIDAVASTARFSVTHVWVEHVDGTVPIVSGTVELPAGSALPISVSAKLDPARIHTGDDDRDAALRGPDWFDAKQFGVWTYASTKIVAAGPSRFGMDGTLTIHGVTQTVHLDVTVSGTPAKPVYHAAGTVDRKAFGMSTTRLDPVIGNPVAITLDIALQ